MKTYWKYSPVILAAALALLPAHAARADDTSSNIAFSDPSKPGTLKILVLHGDVTVHGADVKQIEVKSDSPSAGPTPRKDGMRVLSNSSGYVLSEKGNVATLEYGADGWTGGSADFTITVPRSTSVVVTNSLRGDFLGTDLSGDVDVRTMSGDVKLDGISGGALVETMNGEIRVNVNALADKKPLSFTSMHGEISIHLPEDSKANIRFRTHRGVILTNFDDKALVTKTEITRGKGDSRRDKGHDDLMVAVAPVAPVAAVAPVPPVEPAKVSDSDDDWRGDVRDSIREAAREAADAAREGAEAMREGLEEAHIELSGMGPLPPMTGGKVVSGTLNGGGVEIQAATLTGDITLKKSKSD
jgi:hypothetical protein